MRNKIDPNLDGTLRDFKERLDERVGELKTRMPVIKRYNDNAVIEIFGGKDSRRFSYSISANVLYEGSILIYGLFEFGRVLAKRSWIPCSKWKVYLKDGTNYSKHIGTSLDQPAADELCHRIANEIADYAAEKPGLPVVEDEYEKK